jgi:hypothetical protein
LPDSAIFSNSASHTETPLLQAFNHVASLVMLLGFFTPFGRARC